MAVAGFAAGNVMLLSVSVWAGQVDGHGRLRPAPSALVLGADRAAGDRLRRPAVLQHLPLVRCGNRRTNMDVPISLGILLAAGMSLFETIRGGQHAYFDSAVTLLFFLLIGRYLDRARVAARARRPSACWRSAPRRSPC